MSGSVSQVRFGFIFFIFFYGELSLRRTVLRRKILEPYELMQSLHVDSCMASVMYTLRQVVGRNPGIRIRIIYTQ